MPAPHLHGNPDEWVDIEGHQDDYFHGELPSISIRELNQTYHI